MAGSTDPLELRAELSGALELAAREATAYLEDIGERRVLSADAEAALAAFEAALPDEGDGALAALRELSALAGTAATRSSGPRFFHFVMGGGTPAALGADWLASAYDQVAYAWASSPFAATLERVATGWLRELFELPAEMTGILVSGATMANFSSLAAARSWWAQQHDVDVDEEGLGDLPQAPVFSSGYLHPSAKQAIGMLGLGRARTGILARDGVGRLDLEALERELDSLDGAPAIVIANAGEVNAGDFDPLAEIASLLEGRNAWLHVDGAFGLFARLSPQTIALTAGIERADSIAADAHKWLNVPYDCGFAFVRDADRLAGAFAVGAPYLPRPDDPHPNFGMLTPENSRRARALAVWATLRAYGRSGYRAMVERHLRLAQRLAERVGAEPDLERLAEVPLNIVCFRAKPSWAGDDELDALNTRLGAELLADGRVFAGTTVYDGRVAFRPAIVNWQTSEGDVDLLVEVLLELLERARK